MAGLSPDSMQENFFLLEVEQQVRELLSAERQPESHSWSIENIGAQNK